MFSPVYDENSIWKENILPIRNPGRWVGCLKHLLWMSPNNGVRLCIVRIFAFEFGLLGKLSNSDITWIDWDEYLLEKLLITIYSEKLSSIKTSFILVIWLDHQASLVFKLLRMYVVKNPPTLLHNIPGFQAALKQFHTRKFLSVHASLTT